MKLIQKHTVSLQSHPDLRLRDQIKAYIRCEPEGEDDDQLSFWRSNSSKFPLLQELARDTLSQSASSVPVENMFSIKWKTICFISSAPCKLVVVHSR